MHRPDIEEFQIDQIRAVSYLSTMLYLVKVGFIIAVLTAAATWFLQVNTIRQAKKVCRISAYATAGSLCILCISQIWVAIFGVGAITAAYARQRTYAAGISIFLIISLPGIGFTLNIGGIQLIDLSIIAAVIIGLFAASMTWKGRFLPTRYTNNYSVYVIVGILTFISARDTTITNTMRIILQNLIYYIVPYFALRNSLRDPESIRIMTIFVIAAGLAVSAVAIFESFMVWPMYQAYGQSFGSLIRAGVKMRGGILRAAGPSMNPPLSAAVLALCFVSAFASASIFKTKTSHRIVLCVLASGLFCMQARVGWLGAIAGSLGVLISKRGVKAFVIYVPIIILTFGGGYGLAQFNERFANLVGFSADAKGSSDYRNKADTRSIEIIKQHPFIGQPIPVVVNQMEDLRQGEGIVDFTNGYMAIALFSGLIGLLFFISAILYQSYNSYTGKSLALLKGAGSLSNLGFGVTISAGVMFPFIPTDYRVILVMIFLFTLSNAVITHSHINFGSTVRLRRSLIDESVRKIGA